MGFFFWKYTSCCLVQIEFDSFWLWKFAFYSIWSVCSPALRLSLSVCVCVCICTGPVKVMDERCRHCICPDCVNINLWGWGGYNTAPSAPPSIPSSFSLFTIWLLSDAGPSILTHTHTHFNDTAIFQALISWWVQWSLPRFVKTHTFTHISAETLHKPWRMQIHTYICLQSSQCMNKHVPVYMRALVKQ